MTTPKLGRRSPWIWGGFCLVLVTGVTLTGVGAAGAARREAVRPAAIRRAPAAATATDRGAPAAQADRDVCGQQLD